VRRYEGAMEGSFLIDACETWIIVLKTALLLSDVPAGRSGEYIKDVKKRKRVDWCKAKQSDTWMLRR
jgi:hypothetical protein